MLRCDKFVSPKCIYMTTNNYPSHASQTHFFALENIRICTRRRFPVCVRARMLFLSQEHLTMTFLLCRVPCVDTERERERERDSISPAVCLGLSVPQTQTPSTLSDTRERGLTCSGTQCTSHVHPSQQECMRFGRKPAHTVIHLGAIDTAQVGGHLARMQCIV